MLLAKPLELLGGDLTVLVGEINFISDHDEREGVRHHHHAFREEGRLPVRQALKGLAVRDVVDQETAVGASVEGGPERLVSFLAGCIPDLQGHDAPVDLDLLVAKVCADGRFEAFRELQVLEHLDERGLSYSRVTNGDHFYEALLVRSHYGSTSSLHCF